MTHNTRYEEGDEVVHERYPEEVYQVLKVRNPGSDSPDYVITHTGRPEDIDPEDQDMVTKASKIRKRESVHGDTSDIEVVVHKKHGKTDALFYTWHDEIAYADKGDCEYLLQVNGEVRVKTEDRGMYKSDLTGTDRGSDIKALVEDYNLDDEKLEEMQDSGDLRMLNNPWFEIYKREDGNWMSTDLIAHDYREAMKMFRKAVQEDK